jgi:hypothetical protein
MTKIVKAGIFFIDMRIPVKYALGQLPVMLFALLFCLAALCGCSGKKQDSSEGGSRVVPPVTSPLSREYIGFGVITASFTHITEDPSEGSASIGYLRRGTMVRILRRQTVKTNTGFVSWVLIDGEPQGWLRESVMSIYESENQARTASETISY